jgi:hypothetical protein
MRLLCAALMLASCSGGHRRAEPERVRAFAAAFEAGRTGVLVLFADDVPASRRLELVRSVGGEIAYRYRAIPAVYAIGAEADALAALPGVVAATLDRPVDAPEPGAAATPPRSADPGVGIAVVDAGVRADGLPLGARCFSAFAHAGCEGDDGTALARQVASSERTPVTLYAVRVLEGRAGTEGTLAAGLDWVASTATSVEPPIRVAVTLAGRGGDSPVLRAAARALARAGVTLVAGGPEDRIPALYPEVVSVAGEPPEAAGAAARAAAGALRRIFPASPAALRQRVLTTALPARE